MFPLLLKSLLTSSSITTIIIDIIIINIIIIDIIIIDIIIIDIIIIAIIIIIIAIIPVVGEAVSPLSPGADLNKTAIKGSGAKGKRLVCSNLRKKNFNGKKSITARIAELLVKAILGAKLSLVNVKSESSAKVFGVKRGWVGQSNDVFQ